jgi:hypothetical protein
VTRYSLGSPPPILVIDTNVLLLMIGYQYSLLKKSDALQRSQLLYELRSRDRDILPERFDALWQLFNAAAARIVTEHVISETFSLGKNFRYFSGNRELVWKSALQIFDRPGIEEVSIRVDDLKGLPVYGEILLKAGPTDTGLLFVAEQRQATILTEDGPLWNWASDRNIQWLSLNQIGSE